MPNPSEASNEFEDVLETTVGLVARARALFERLHGNMTNPDEIPMNPAEASEVYLEGTEAFRDVLRSLDTLLALHQDCARNLRNPSPGARPSR